MCVCGITRQKKDVAHSNLDVNAGDKMILSTEWNRKWRKNRMHTQRDTLHSGKSNEGIVLHIAHTVHLFPL